MFNKKIKEEIEMYKNRTAVLKDDINKIQNSIDDLTSKIVQLKNAMYDISSQLTEVCKFVRSANGIPKLNETKTCASQSEKKFSEFLASECYNDEGSVIKLKELYKAYVEYSNEKEIDPMSYCVFSNLAKKILRVFIATDDHNRRVNLISGIGNKKCKHIDLTSGE